MATPRNYKQDEISLETAMTMNLTQKIRSWEVNGLQIKPKKDIPNNTTVYRTLVLKDFDNNYAIHICFTIDGDPNKYQDEIAKFLTLDQLKENYPQLFELNGNLHAFA